MQCGLIFSLYFIILFMLNLRSEYLIILFTLMDIQMEYGLWSLFENQWIEERYRLVQCIGIGGNGGVFQADHVVEDRILRQVAIKLIPYNESQLDTCMLELNTAISLRHENLIELFDSV